jgi:hypothetical protein
LPSCQEWATADETERGTISVLGGDPYLLTYRFDLDTLTIMRIVHGAMNVGRELAGE